MTTTKTTTDRRAGLHLRQGERPTPRDLHAEQRNREAADRLSKRAFLKVLGQTCHAHRLGPGIPCWTLTTAIGTERPALCDHRVRGAGYEGRPSQRWGTSRRSRDGEGS